MRELEGNISITLKALELKLEGTRKESLEIKSDLELKIEANRKAIVRVKTDLTVVMEKLNASISKQIAQ